MRKQLTAFSHLQLSQESFGIGVRLVSKYASGPKHASEQDVQVSHSPELACIRSSFTSNVNKRKDIFNFTHKDIKIFAKRTAKNALRTIKVIMVLRNFLFLYNVL